MFEAPVVRRQEEDGESLVQGKMNFQFSFFHKLCKTMRGQTKKKYIFAHTFLVISWNLMCRGGNSVSIQYEHLEWDEDSLAIWFGHMKHDQEGDRQRDPRHIFANQMEPDICPILSVAIYFAVVGFSKTSLLFPGQQNFKRCNGYFLCCRRNGDRRARTFRLRITFGKERFFYLRLWCCTGGPSSASVCLRAGWNLPGVQDTYVRYEATGDRVIGRFVTGLPYETPDFAILPPFCDTVDDNVRNGINICYPNAPEIFKNIYARSCWLHCTSLFRDSTLLSELKPKVLCRRWQTGDAIRASGIPPHLGVVVNMENRLDSVDKSIVELHSAVADNVHRMQGQLSSMEAKVDGLTSKCPGSGY
ncbi:Integrase-like, catalytic domain [Phytophthora cactorum]|nr:Integrase-like, catalytic domain [Phytophthora cactorum]